MAKKKFGLGRGLEALLPVGSPENGGLSGTSSGRQDSPDVSAETLIPISKIRANPDQPRKTFSEEALSELAASIREHGVIQPLIVEKTAEDAYTLVAGERRFRAAALAGLSEVPAVIRSYSGEARMEVALIENIQRADLNPVEEALAYKSLMESAGLSQEEAAAKLGKNRSTLANSLRLLKLPECALEALKTGAITAGHARAILAVPAEAQEALFGAIIRDGLSVREAEGWKAPAEPPTPVKKPPPKPRNADISALEQQFIEVLGTKVVIDGDLSKGTVKIDYFSMDDLDRLYNIFTKKGESGAS